MNLFRISGNIFLPLLFFYSQFSFSQYGKQTVQWVPDKPKVDTGSFSVSRHSDVVILDQRTEIKFYTTNNARLYNYVRYLIKTEKGADQLNNFRLPESFDQAYDLDYHKQGRAARIKTPNIQEYRINTLSARKFVSNKWIDVKTDHASERIRRINVRGESPGEFYHDDEHTFRFLDIHAGDILDVYYEAEFISPYSTNIFYFCNQFPKVRCDYIMSYKVPVQYADDSFLLAVNTASGTSLTNKAPGKNETEVTHTITLRHLPPIDYPAHSFPGKKLPYIFADFNFVEVLYSVHHDAGTKISETRFYRPANFEWVIVADTERTYTRIYDKQYAAIRKFLTRMPPAVIKDSTNIDFFRMLCDTLNNFRYITSNQLHYNEPNLKDIYSGEHLLKRRLIQHEVWPVYKDILEESNAFYYLVSVQDRRFSEHSTHFHINKAYDRSLLALPFKNTYLYFLPRYSGLKYHLNELPFYFEGSLANLNPENFARADTNKNSKLFKFIRTHKGSFNENTRTENGQVTIPLDSTSISLSMKESLTGQFSTVLRPLYLGDVIDSTISPHYFKRCVDKPRASQIKIKLSTRITEYPFRYTFNCSERIARPVPDQIDLSNWFSFVLSKRSIPELPRHEYFFDFDFTDSYAYQLKFSDPVELKNAEAFTKKIGNEYFELESGIIKNDERNYLLRITLIVKKMSIPYEKMDLLSEIIAELETLNKFNLQYRRL